MATQSLGMNIQARNPYDYTVGTSGTIELGTDVELIYDTTNVTSRQDLALIVRQMLTIIEQSIHGGSGQPYGPPG